MFIPPIDSKLIKRQNDVMSWRKDVIELEFRFRQTSGLANKGQGNQSLLEATNCITTNPHRMF